MGFQTDRFLQPVDPNLLCGVCSCVLDIPTTTPCGHTFCGSCINTWLDTPGARSCPECRSQIDKHSIRPILCLRNFILTLEVRCLNRSRGCDETMKIESQETHLKKCPFTVVTCVGCQTEMNQWQLADHQMSCSVLTDILNEEEDGGSHSTSIRRTNYSYGNCHRSLGGRACSSSIDQQLYSDSCAFLSSSSTQVIRLLHRISSLERQVARLLDDLQETYANNSFLYLKNRALTEDKERRLKHNRLLCETKRPFRFSMDYEIKGQKDIAEFSLHIARHLVQKPVYVDSDKVFKAVRTCYEMRFYPAGKDSRIGHDIHMLLATAFASNWFTSAQRIAIGCWLQILLRHQADTNERWSAQ